MAWAWEDRLNFVGIALLGVLALALGLSLWLDGGALKVAGFAFVSLYWSFGLFRRSDGRKWPLRTDPIQAPPVTGLVDSGIG